MTTMIERLPTLSELRTLARSVGWEDEFDWPTMQVSLDGSLYGVVVAQDGDVVGTGRVVGDGSRYFYVQDVIVCPDAAGEGAATLIVERLLSWIKSHASGSAIVGLFASPEAHGVYSTLGFLPATQDPLGMTLRIKGGSQEK